MGKTTSLALSIKIAGKLDGSLRAAIKSANSEVSSISRTMSKVGTVGLAAMTTMAVGTVAALADCTKEAQAFEEEMANVVKYVDGLADATGKISDNIWGGNGKTFAENYTDMKKNLIDLSTQIPVTIKDLTEMAAAAGQSGKGFDDLFSGGFLRDVAMASKALDIDAETAGAWAAKWEKSLDITHEGVMELLDVINYLGANSPTTAAEIANVVNTTASLGEVAGFAPSAIAALADAMLAMGVADDQAANSISRIVVNMSKGYSATKKQKEQWEALGLTAEGVAAALQTDASGTMIDVLERIGNLDADKQVAALSTLFGQWAIKGAAKLVGNLDVYKDALAMAGDPSLYSGSMLREYNIKAGTTESTSMMLGNAWRGLKIAAGEAFLPAKQQLSQTLIDIMNDLRNDMPEIGELTRRMSEALAGGISTASEKIKEAWPKIKEMLEWLMNNGDKVAKSIGGIALGFLGMKFAPQIEGAARGAGSMLFGKSNGAGKRTGGMLNGLGSLFGWGQKTGAAIQSAGPKGIFGWLKGKGGNAVKAAKNSGVAKYLSGVWGAWGNASAAGMDAAKATGSAAWNTIQALWPRKGPGTSVASLNGEAPLWQTVMWRTASMKQAGSGMLGSLGNLGKAGGGLLSSIWSAPLAGFGSLLAGAAPIIGVISSIIAVVSILGDHLEDIRGIVEKVFGDKGLAVFDKFVDKLRVVKDFIGGLFVDGGVAKALAPLREGLAGFVGENGLAAFDALVNILQSVMGVVGRLVDFSVTKVKPIILEIFTYITQTVIPGIMNVFALAEPYISGIISNLGNAVMTGMDIIAGAIKAAIPVVEWIIDVIMSIGTVAIPAILAAVEVFSGGIRQLMEDIKSIFTGLVDFVAGAFTGDWQRAWQGVKEVFGGIFNSLADLLKTPMNAVIAMINRAISGINSLGIKIPDWVPEFGGRNFSLNIPPIPMLAKGGWTNGPSIAGEDGREAVISFQRSQRARNLALWSQAGKKLGAPELKTIGGGGGGTGGGFTFAPQIIIQGNADKNDVAEALREAYAQFKEFANRYERERRRVAYG